MEQERMNRALNNQFKSEFLERETKQNIGYDPTSQLGQRLKYWENGDTILSVTLKKFKYRTLFLLNPDNYTKKQKKEVIKQGQMYNTYIFLTLLLMSTPVAVYLAYIVPRIQRAKREYYMHQYDKMDLLKRTLGIKIDKMNLKQIKNILNKKEKQ